MNRSFQAVADWHMMLVHCWISSTKRLVDTYVDMLDPRPDLAVPAKSTRQQYDWWWG